MKILQKLWIILLFCWQCDCRQCNDLPSKTVCPMGCACCLRNSQCGDPDLKISCIRSQTDSLFLNDLSTLLKGLTFVNVSLTHFSLQGATMKSILSEICALNDVEELLLTDVELSSIPSDCFKNLTNLSVLSLEFNNIVSLPDNLLIGLYNLTEIRLAFNRIENMQPELFLYVDNSSKLNKVDVSYNRLTTLDFWPFFLRTHEFTVSVANNNISTFTNKLNYRYTCAMPALNGNVDLGSNSIYHIMDVVIGYGYSSIRDQQIWCLFRDSLNILFINNPLVCDCIDYSVYNILKNVYHMQGGDEIYCEAPLPLKHLKLIPLLEHMEVFVCDVTHDCPLGCKCTNQPYTRSLIVSCSGQNATEMVQHIPLLPASYMSGYSYQLDFSHNELSVVPPARDYYSECSTVCLNDNRIEQIDIDALKSMVKSLTVLYLHNNKLTSLPSEVQKLNFVKLKKIHLYNNPWSCDCNALWMKKWLLSLDSVVVNLNAITCKSDDIRDGRSVTMLDDSNFVCGHLLSTNEVLYRVIPSVVGCCIVVVSACISMLYAKRKWLYSKFHVHPFDNDECHGEDMTYDAFISSANEDEDITDSIVKLLESEGYKVCYHKRDFTPGQPTVVNIGECITRSKRTLFYITNNFMLSNWCMWEFETALFLNLNKPNSYKYHRLRLIAIVDNVDVSTVTHHSLRTYLQSFTYIEQNNVHFKRNLLYALPMHKLGNRVEAGNYGRQPSTCDDSDMLIA